MQRATEHCGHDGYSESIQTVTKGPSVHNNIAWDGTPRWVGRNRCPKQEGGKEHKPDREQANANALERRHVLQHHSHVWVGRLALGVVPDRSLFR